MPLSLGGWIVHVHVHPVSVLLENQFTLTLRTLWMRLDLPLEGQNQSVPSFAFTCFHLGQAYSCNRWVEWDWFGWSESIYSMRLMDVFLERTLVQCQIYTSCSRLVVQLNHVKCRVSRGKCVKKCGLCLLTYSPGQCSWSCSYAMQFTRFYCRNIFVLLCNSWRFQLREWK